jgi:uncharacterized protein YqhQ
LKGDAIEMMQSTGERQIPQYGGQAVIEGVMMRGKDRIAVAVRRADGSIALHESRIETPAMLRTLYGVPFLRGLATLVGALTVGTRALLWSAQIAAGVREPNYDAEAVTPLMLATSLGMSTALMFIGPAAGSNWLERRIGLRSGLGANALEGIIRIGVIAAYVTAVSLTREGHRLFQYHGAEHKAINAFEAGAPLTPESVARFPLEHPRCGTAFLFTVAALNVVLRVALLPIVAGLAYEFIRFSARNMANPAVRALVMPNLLMQRLTTREPDLTQIEVSIRALEAVLAQAQ